MIESAQGHYQRGGDRPGFATPDGYCTGAENYARNLCTERSPEDIELFFAHCSLLPAAGAAGIQAFDAVYSDANNEAGFLQETALIKPLGFDGKSLINPWQIKLLHKVFAQIVIVVAHARQVVEAAEAVEQGRAWCYSTVRWLPGN